MRQLTWPQAFALVFGALPAFAFTVAVLATTPTVGWPLLGLGVVAYGLRARSHTCAQRAASARAELAAYSAMIAAPLPEMPTVPMTAL